MQQQLEQALKKAEPMYHRQQQEAEAKGVDWTASDAILNSKGYLTPHWDSYRKAAREQFMHPLRPGIRAKAHREGPVTYHPHMMFTRETIALEKFYATRGWNPNL